MVFKRNGGGKNIGSCLKLATVEVCYNCFMPFITNAFRKEQLAPSSPLVNAVGVCC